jgi:hypothetical protein
MFFQVFRRLPSSAPPGIDEALFKEVYLSGQTKDHEPSLPSYEG